MNEDRPITGEYVGLSWRAACLAGYVDQHLGGDAFEQITRFHCWSLTAQMIVELQSAAISLGVPAALIEDIDLSARRQLARPGFVAAAISAQAEYDKRKQGGNHARRTT